MNKGIAVGITILFLGLAIQPSIATVQPEKIDVEPDINYAKGLVAQLQVVINEILQEYGHIPIIRTLGNIIYNIIVIIWRVLYCTYLLIVAPLTFILALILTLLGINDIELVAWAYAYLYLFDKYCFPLSSNSPLKSISNINRIYTSDSPTLTGLDDCPCMQE